MKLNWQGHGQKHYGFQDKNLSTAWIMLEWNALNGEMVYSLSSVHNNVRRAILSFRVPDFSWQSPEPSFFNESVGGA